jgi:hypothetical protein
LLAHELNFGQTGDPVELHEPSASSRAATAAQVCIAGAKRRSMNSPTMVEVNMTI